MFPAKISSSRWATEELPGIGSIIGDLASNQAMEICTTLTLEVWCTRSARGGECQIGRFFLRVDILRNSRTVSRRPSRVREKQAMP